MTSSEDSFRLWAKKRWVGCFIVKWPDFKVTGLVCSAGMPDFLVVSGGEVFFVEVKKWNGRFFTSAQKVVFDHIRREGGRVFVWVKLRRGFDFFEYF